ncbi:hypothetical protein HanRHA438_Chr12g0563881 [Helianthus annuus]|nr:hypothetical protein HanRHA438_Chr12g0563881 [Helianthus annuus]
MEDGSKYMYMCVVCICVCEKGEARQQRPGQAAEDDHRPLEMVLGTGAEAGRARAVPHTYALITLQTFDIL